MRAYSDECMLMTNTPAAELPDTPASSAVREVSQAVADAFNQGNAHFKAGRWAPARAAYEAALKDDPQMEPAALQWVRCLVMQGDHQAARDGFALLLKTFPSNYSGWLEAGVCVAGVCRSVCRSSTVPASSRQSCSSCSSTL